MMKNLPLATALLTLALAVGCATGGKGPPPPIQIMVNAPVGILYITQQVTFTAQVTGTSNQAVTWSLSGTACTGSGNPCGAIDPSSGVYTAPATAPNPNTITITATSKADNTTTGNLVIKVLQLTVNVTPSVTSVTVGLTQQFTAVSVPDDSPQTFTWAVSCTPAPCGTIVPDSTNPALAVYTAPASPSAAGAIQVTATSKLDPTGIGAASITAVNSRLGNSGAPTTYAFRFSGFDSSGATALVGNFVVAADGVTISSGIEDVLTASGFAEYTSVIGTYTATSNNQGTILLHASGAPADTPARFTAVLDSNGDIQIVESDSPGTGSGVVEPVTAKLKNVASLSGPVVFGVSGVDNLNGHRVGYAGSVALDGTGTITSGLLDTNEAGTAGSASDVTGSYTMTNGVGTMQLTSVSLGKTYNFNLYGVSGSGGGTNPLTLYAISSDSAPTGSNPAVSGTVVLQDPKGSPYNNATMKGTAVASLTGADNSGSNVSLTLLNTDGSGNLSGNFDQNDAGKILSVSSFGTGYTYAATGSGRYTIKLLGDPTASTVVPPLTFLWYASGNDRGFLLDQSSSSVITGTITPQGKGGSTFGASELAGTFAAATTGSGTSGVDPVAANMLVTWVNPSQGIAGTEYIGTAAPQTLTGTYAMFLTSSPEGTGTIALTAPSAQNYVMYFVDTTGCTGSEQSCEVLDFLMIDVDKTFATPSVIFARQ